MITAGTLGSTFVESSHCHCKVRENRKKGRRPCSSVRQGFLHKRRPPASKDVEFGTTTVSNPLSDALPKAADDNGLTAVV